MKGACILLEFKNIGNCLMIKLDNGTLTSFVVAGPGKEFQRTDPIFDGDTIVVSSSDVPTPKYVRYGWAGSPLVNLYNKTGLSTITFRTDE